MRKANESRKEIDRLLKKSKIKEANNLDNTKEIETVCSLMVKNGPTAEEMEVYKDRIRNIVLSLMTEPVSDIPKGQIIQLIKLEKQELDNFKSIYFEYKAGMLTINDLKEQHTKVNAVMQYLDEILMSFVHNDDCKEIPGAAQHQDQSYRASDSGCLCCCIRGRDYSKKRYAYRVQLPCKSDLRTGMYYPCG